MKKEHARTAVVTGAGSGLGREICLGLARKGYKLLAADLTAERAEATCAEARALGAPLAVAASCDVRKVEDIQKLAGLAERELGELGLLVNNAGVAAGGPFESQPLEDWKWLLDTNLWGVIYGCHVFLPRLKAQGRGHILNIASAAGLLSPPGMASYNVAKAGVVALSETLYAELSGTGVGVTVACPTFFKTGLLETARTTDAQAREFAQKMFDRSRSSAREVAAACVRAVERGDAYVVPNLDGKMLWGLKRMAPRGFLGLASKIRERL